ncbi:MAG: threonine/serine exporter [Ruminococcaceae bacterium]|nr:threonine/serine exporter [Oscillospiraceae bacterium]
MTVWHYLFEFVICAFSVASFSVITSAPRNTILASSLVSAIAYVIYRFIHINAGKEIFAYFVASLVISILSEILARVYKNPSTVFIFPGILPLVPGVGLYNSMLYLVQRDYEMFTAKAVTTLFISGSIAIAVAIVHITARSVFPRKNGIVPISRINVQKEDNELK